MASLVFSRIAELLILSSFKRRHFKNTPNVFHKVLWYSIDSISLSETKVLENSYKLILGSIHSLRLTVVIEKVEDNYYVSSVLELPSRHTQAKDLNELMERVKEAIELYLETEGIKEKTELVGIRFIEVPSN